MNQVFSAQLLTSKHFVIIVGATLAVALYTNQASGVKKISVQNATDLQHISSNAASGAGLLQALKNSVSF